MKKSLKICMALLMVLVLLSGSALAAKTSVIYRGGADEFVFLLGPNNETSSDLFDGFKDVLPGDVLTQKIRVINRSDNRVRIYIRVEGDEMVDKELLDQLQLKVVSPKQELFEAPASETAQLTEYKLLGSFKAKGSTELTVTLTVPADMGNEFMGRVGVVPWSFMVEEIPEDETPDTGDWFQMSLWIGMAAVLAVLIVVLIMAQRKRRVQEGK